LPPTGARFFLVIDVSELLPAVIANNETSGRFFDGLGWWEAASGGDALTKNPKTINQSADNDCANEPPDKYVEPAVSEQITGNDA
jgi:hypothetical protein